VANSTVVEKQSEFFFEHWDILCYNAA